jgi:thiol-disulfide isomerase/thioredoxin
MILANAAILAKTKMSECLRKFCNILPRMASYQVVIGFPGGFMRPFFWLAAVLCLSACTQTQQVQSLTEFYHPDNSQQLVAMTPELALDLLQQPSDQPLLVEFSADWCGPCRQLIRPLRRLAAASQGRYRVVTVDVTGGLEVMEKFGVAQKLPAFHLQIPGIEKPILRYGSGETFDQIAHFLKNDSLPRSVPLPIRPLEKPRAYKAVLVAGSSDNANFLQEIYWNYSWLLQKGYKESEIGCFYGQPDVLQYAFDREQFDEMKSLLEACHPLQKQELLESIRLSLKGQPESFYLYVTAHGAPPVPTKYAETFKEKCFAQAPALTLDQTPPDCASSQGLTADDLAKVMKDSAATKKYLVLQGCYTGGFISARDDAASAPSPLAQLPNIRILTASSAKKPSFGCHSGAKATLFGSAYGVTVIDDKQKLEAMNWSDVYQGVTREVTRLEKEMKLAGRDASKPQFFMNE